MIHTFGDSTVIKSFAGAFQISRSSRSSTFFHLASGGDHYGSTRIARKGLDCGFGMSKALISYQGIHLYNRAMSSLSKSTRWCTKLLQHTTSRQTAKLKFSIRKSRIFCKRWPIPAVKTRANSLRMLYGRTGQHIGLC
ncbi:hypothetical protein CR513_09863, partial [Mucuna pruriens]